LLRLAVSWLAILNQVQVVVLILLQLPHPAAHKIQDLHLVLVAALLQVVLPQVLALELAQVLEQVQLTVDQERTLVELVLLPAVLVLGQVQRQQVLQLVLVEPELPELVLALAQADPAAVLEAEVAQAADQDKDLIKNSTAATKKDLESGLFFCCKF
jgi:hypothetical protein